jgi:hypothetical protein
MNYIGGLTDLEKIVESGKINELLEESSTKDD